MLNEIRFVALRHLRRRPLRPLLATLSVVLGVSLSLAVSLVNRATIESFEETARSLQGKAALTVFGAEAGFAEEVVARIRRVPGVADAVGILQTPAFYVPAPGQPGRSLMVLGLDLLQESTVRTYRGAVDEEILDDPLVFLNQPDSVVLTRTFASEHHLKLDDRIALKTAYGLKHFTVRGLLTPDGAAKAYGGALVIMDIDGARISFGKEGKFDRVDVVARKGVEPDTLAGELRAALGPAHRVEKASAHAESFARVSRSFQGILEMTSFLALFVAMFLIANTITISVADRRRELGTLRAVGAAPWKLVALFTAEGTLMGLLGSAIGIPAGRAVGEAMVEGVSYALTTLNQSPTHIGALRLTQADIVGAFLLGTFSAFFAALFPAWRATRVQPLEAVRTTPVSEGPRQNVWALAPPAAGVALLVALRVSVGLRLAHANPAFEVLDTLFAVGGCTLVAPGLVTLLLRLTRRGLRHLPGRAGFVALLACENLLRASRRTAGAIISLVLGLTLVLADACSNASFRGSVSDWWERSMPWELIVSASQTMAIHEWQPLHESLGAELARIPGQVERGGHPPIAFRYARLRYQDRDIYLQAFDRPVLEAEWRAFDLRGGRDPRPVGERIFADPTAVVVSENFLEHFGKRVGDEIELDTPAGSTRFRIIDQVIDYTSTDGTIYLSREVYKRLFDDALVNLFAVKAMPGHAGAVRAAIEERFGAQRAIFATPIEVLRRDGERMIDDSFAYTRAIEAAVLAVALLSLFGALLVSLMGRTRELGMLRATGMSRTQLGGMVFCEAVLQGLFGSLVAVALGLYLSWTWVVEKMSRIVGFPVEVRFDTTAAVVVVISGVVVAILAGVLPALRAARLPISQVLASE